MGKYIQRPLRLADSLTRHILKSDKKSYATATRKSAVKPIIKEDQGQYKKLVVHIEESRRFIIDSLLAFKIPKQEAQFLADVLVAADYRGVYSEGIIRLERFIKKLSDETLRSLVEPRVLNETPATALVNGRNGFGVTIGNFCMDLAIQKALDCGIGWINAQMSNDICMASWYILRAMQNDLIGIVMSNNSPVVLPTNGSVAMLGSNCFAFGAMGDKDHFLFDMAASVKSLSDIEYYHQLEQPLPAIDWAFNNLMQPTDNSSIALRSQNLLPAGGYKGYAFGAMIDILCGVLSDANYLTRVPRWTMDHSQNPANLGQLFIAINPSFFEPSFKQRLEDFNSRLKRSAETDPEKTIIVPGEIEAIRMSDVDNIGGIQYDPLLLRRCQNLAKWLSIRPLAFNTSSRS